MESEFVWNECVIDADDPLNKGLIILMAFDSDGTPKPIGTAFIINDEKEYAIAFTAAHNFSGIHSIQNPQKNYHRTALAEFLPDLKPLNIDPDKVQAFCFPDNGAISCHIEEVYYDDKSDLAVFRIKKPQKQPDIWFGHFELDEFIPRIGDKVAVCGYANMNVNCSTDDTKKFSLQLKLLIRQGRVVNHHEAHLLCRDFCIETNIPVYAGMSGGPVMLMGDDGQNMKPFGIICSDLDGADDMEKLNRLIAGSSIVSLIRAKRDVIEKSNVNISMNIDHTKIISKLMK